MEWGELPAEEGTEVELKGFLNQNHERQWVLSSEPHLKSCCLGKRPQIMLEGDFIQFSRDIPLQVKGIFHSTEKGFILSEVYPIQKIDFPFWSVLIFLGICLLVFFFKARKLETKPTYLLLL